MQVQQLSVKIFARQREFDQAPLIPIFHRWIREKRLPDSLLIDVADYRHVPDGPGVMIIGHDAHYGLDARGGQLGFCYSRKRDPIGEAGPRLEQALIAALLAAEALQKEPAIHGALGFDAGRLEVRIMSRLVALSTAETHAAFAPILREVLARIYGTSEITLEHLSDPGQPLGVRVHIAGEHDIATLIERL